MKKQLLFTFFILSFLSFSANAQVGFTCDNPIQIPSLPYQSIDNTANYGDIIDFSQGVSCGDWSGTNYLEGNEVFYNFTAPFTSNITITMNPLDDSSTNSSLFIYEGCSNVGTACLSGVANTTTDLRELNLLVFEGQTYTIVISSSSQTQTIAYDLIIQKEDCSPKPTGLGVSNITSVGAKLTWANTGNYASWQVAFQDEGATIPVEDGVTVTNPFLVKTGLSADTSYQFWVRGLCPSGNGAFSQWSGPYVFRTGLCDYPNTCAYTFVFSSEQNNGWNGAVMEVRQNGYLRGTIGTNYTSENSWNQSQVQLCKNIPFEVVWTVPGTAPEECGLTIKNSFGQTLYVKQPSDMPGETIFTGGAVTCVAPICQVSPSNISVTQLSSTSAVADWTSATAESWDIFLVPLDESSPNADSVPTYANVQKPFTFYDLSPNTSYQIYVRSNCTSYLKTPWSSVGYFSVFITCYEPTNLSVDQVTTTSAKLNWTKGMPTDNSWEILMIPSLTSEIPTTVPSENPVLENGATLTTVTGNTTFKNFTDLVQATVYICYIRTVCSDTDKSAWTTPYLFYTSICNEEDKCTYRFVLSTTNQNTWNGATMQVRQNGIVVANLGANYINNSNGILVNLCDEVPFDLYWSEGGFSPETIGVQIQSPFQDILYTMLPGQSNPSTILYQSEGDCTPPACPKPTLLSVTADLITQVSAELSWTETGDATQWEVYAVPVESTLPVNETPLNIGVEGYYLATANPFTVTGLQPGVEYVYYVRSICSPNEIGTWTILSPKKFITKPLNDDCSAAIPVPVNAVNDCTNFISGSTFGATGSVEITSCTGGKDDDIWYSFVSSSDVHIISFSNIVGTSTNIDHAVYEGFDCGTMEQLYCSDPNSSIAKNLTIGQTYLIRVFTREVAPANGSNPKNATFDLCIKTPSPLTNDECSIATVIPISQSILNQTSVEGELTRATASIQPSTCPGMEDDDVWFQFVATGPRHLISINNIQLSSIDLNFAVFSNTDCNNLALINCYSDTSAILENLTLGQDYKIRVWSVSNTQVEVSFEISVSNIYPPLVATTTQFTNEQLVTNVLVNNPCVDISNITSSTGSNFNNVNGIGYFTNTNPFFPITSGVVLSTGNASNVGGPNLTILGDGINTWLGDDDLSAIQATQIPPISGNLYNATKLEFDFTSQNEFMSFNFLFASEEYGTFQCSYADAFAFLLTDLTTGITTNLAVVPGTASPVSVITIRNSENNPDCSSVNEAFFDTYFDDLLAQTAATNFNGQTELMSASSAIVSNNPYHIKMVIADRSDSAYDSAVFIQAGSFSSGPPQCTDKVQLVAFIDANNNGTKEDTESSFTYGSFVYKLNNGGDINNISSPIGNYTIYDENPLNSYDFSYEVHPEYATYFSAGTINHNDISIAVGSGTQTLYFPITQIQGYNDVTVSIVPVGQPTAGFSYTNKIFYTNLGTAATSGTITYTKDDAVTISSDQLGVVATTEGFTFDFSNLAPYETRSFNISINVPSIPVVNIDDVLEGSVAISAPSDDINLNNNTYVNSQIVVASYDPNDKMEAHGEKLDINNFSQDDYLFYTIRFQNTGTANAINIRIEDVLDAQLDEESIRMISASHNYVMERVGNVLVWKFDYIYLPSILENEELSNGYLTFKIKVKPGFEVGDIIPNFAEIYFDTNPAIITNTFTSTFEEQLSTPEFTSGNLLMYPNPSNGMVYINTQNTTENLKEINLYDVLGKMILSTKNLSSKQSNLNVGSLAKGVYMVEITTENNFKQTKKLVVN
ncbi:DUF7619 domain-containing protein [Flavobacterium soli]|uniref:DUF7619 domain-containing protein n=1 Tax=Flavobacterium soli TaxID=344881 RepID=UPI00146E16D5|nr:choice-of-anchor L domain-containing protein [Flavobacterium soli]